MPICTVWFLLRVRSFCSRLLLPNLLKMGTIRTPQSLFLWKRRTNVQNQRLSVHHPNSHTQNRYGSEVLTSLKPDTEQSSTLRGSIHHFAPCWSLPGQSLGDHQTKWQLIQTVEEAWQPLHAGWSLKSGSSHFFTFPMGAIGATPLDVSRIIPSNMTDQR